MTKILTPENIELNMVFDSKEAAIEEAGNILVKNGYVSAKYIQAMQAREKIVSVYIGNHVAIPHGIGDSQQEIYHSGISVIQVPNGVSFGEDKTAYVLFGIAGKAQEHIEILSNIAIFCSEKENVLKLRQAKMKEDILSLLTGSFE